MIPLQMIVDGRKLNQAALTLLNAWADAKGRHPLAKDNSVLNGD